MVLSPWTPPRPTKQQKHRVRDPQVDDEHDFTASCIPHGFALEILPTEGEVQMTACHGTNPLCRDLTGADLREADLSLATLDKSWLSGAEMSGAVLVGAKLGLANLSGADLTGASLKGAWLVSAVLVDTVLAGADLSGAWLANSRGLTQGQLSTACGDGSTRLPDGLAVPPCSDRASR